MSKLVGQIMELFTQYLSLVGLLSDFFFFFTFKYLKISVHILKGKPLYSKTKGVPRKASLALETHANTSLISGSCATAGVFWGCR